MLLETCADAWGAGEGTTAGYLTPPHAEQEELHSL